MSKGHGILDGPMAGKLPEIGSQKRGHVARRRIDLAGAWPLEGSTLFTGAPTRPAPWAVTLHGATKQIARQRQRRRAHPERTSYALVHQSREARVETTFKGNSQQDHGRIGIEILLPWFMVRARFPGI